MLYLQAENEKVFKITIINNKDADGTNKTFRIKLFEDPKKAFIGPDSEAIVTIIDNDGKLQLMK